MVNSIQLYGKKRIMMAGGRILFVGVAVARWSARNDDFYPAPVLFYIDI